MTHSVVFPTAFLQVEKTALTHSVVFPTAFLQVGKLQYHMVGLLDFLIAQGWQDEKPNP